MCSKPLQLVVFILPLIIEAWAMPVSLHYNKIYYKYLLFLLHTVSCVAGLAGSKSHFHSAISSTFFLRHCLLSSGTQHQICLFSSEVNENMKYLNPPNFSWIHKRRLQLHACASAPRALAKGFNLRYFIIPRQHFLSFQYYKTNTHP